MGHFARDKICPARGKKCVKCGDKGLWTACCRSEAKSKKGGRVREGRPRGDKQRRSSDVKHDPESGNRQVIQVEYDSGNEAFTFPINFKEEIAC